jgi:hypothetical protein
LIPYVQNAVLPNTAIDDAHAVATAAGARAVPYITNAIDHLAAIADHQGVPRTNRAQVQIVTIAPHGARTADQHAVAGTEQNAMGADNQSAIADDQAVATTLTLTNDQRTGIVPNRAGAGHRHVVARHTGAGINVTGAVDQTAAIANHQAVTGAGITE